MENQSVYLTEWILTPLIMELFSFLTSASSYKVDKKRIISVTTNLSYKMAEITHLVNYKGHTPIHALAEALKVTYAGPQGIDKQNVPDELRNIHPSYEGRIDPTFTPDRENTGIVNYFTLKSKFFKHK
jgi:DNA-directed RNA polymerase beta subunit